MGTAMHPLRADRVRASFVIFDIRALWRSGLSVRMPRCQKLQMTAKPGSGTGCFIDVPNPYGNNGRQRVKFQPKSFWLGRRRTMIAYA